MDLGLVGARALVGGGSGGLGGAIAGVLAAEGARVALTARPSERLDAAAARLGGVAVPADLSTPAGPAAAVAAAVDGTRRSGPAGRQQRRAAARAIRGPRRGGLAASHRRHALERAAGHQGGAAPPAGRATGRPSSSCSRRRCASRSRASRPPISSVRDSRGCSSRWCPRSRPSASTAWRRAASRHGAYRPARRQPASDQRRDRGADQGRHHQRASRSADTATPPSWAGWRVPAVAGRELRDGRHRAHRRWHDPFAALAGRERGGPQPLDRVPQSASGRVRTGR